MPLFGLCHQPIGTIELDKRLFGDVQSENMVVFEVDADIQGCEYSAGDYILAAISAENRYHAHWHFKKLR